MSLPSQKKAAMEKLIVVGLLAIFGAMLTKGPLMKTLKAKAQGMISAAPSVTTQLVAPVASAAQTHLDVTLTAATAAAMPSATPGVSSTAKAYTAQGLRDPFESRLPSASQAPAGLVATDLPSSSPASSGPQPPASSPPARLQVEGVLWGGPQPKAIINGNMYSVNDVVNGVKIVAIDYRGVAVDHNGARAYYSPSTVPLGADGGVSQNSYPQSYDAPVGIPSVPSR